MLKSIQYNQINNYSMQQLWRPWLILEPVAQRLLHLIVGILPPAIMKHLNIMGNESSLFLVLPTTQLNPSFLYQADFSIPTQDVSWIKKAHNK